MTDYSYVYRSAKFDAKIFNFFGSLFILFYFRSEKFRTSVNGKIKWTSERKSWKVSHRISQIGKRSFIQTIVLMNIYSTVEILQVW